MEHIQEERSPRLAARGGKPYPKAADVAFEVGLVMLIALSLALTAQFILWAVSFPD